MKSLLPLLLLVSALASGSSPAPAAEPFWFNTLIANWTDYGTPEYLDFVGEAKPQVAQVGFYGVTFYSVAHTPFGKGYPAHFPVQGTKECGEFFRNLNQEVHARGTKVVGHFNTTFILGDPEKRAGFFDWYHNGWDPKTFGPKPTANPIEMLAVNAEGKLITTESYKIGGWPEYHEQRVEVIYNGVAPAQRVTDEEAQKCKAELGISGCYPLLGVVGSLYPVKGHRFLLDAMPEILRRWPEARVLVIGRGELEVALKEQVERLAIGANVHFLGMRQDVPRLLSVLDAFVLPSLSEGLSLALLEAMASGKPVVATLVGGNPELIDHGRTGFLVQPEDARDLASNLVKLLSDPGMMQQFGRQGEERVRQHFSMGQMVDRYRDLYARSLTVHYYGMNKK